MLADEQARQEALEPEKSFIVQAPAGSGKTELLIQRYLRLLGLVNFPEEILAMTFTRKAAAEMKERILSALTFAQAHERPEKDHDALTWELAQKALERDQTKEWNLMDNPARLRIVTIDSFCSSLTRRMPLLSKMGAGLNIQENAKSLYRETARNILNLTEDTTNPYGELVRNILRHIDNSKEDFIKRIVQLLEKRDQWMISFFDPRENIEAHPLNDENRKDLEQTMEKLVQSKLAELESMLTPEIQQRILKLGNYSGRNLEIDYPTHPSTCLGELKNFPDLTVENLNIWKEIANLLLTQDKTPTLRKQANVKLGFPAGKDPNAKRMKEEFLELIDSLRTNPALVHALAKVKKLPRGQFTDSEWDLLKSTIRLLAEINHQLKKVFSSRQLTDFTEISLSAINGLVLKDENGQELPTDLLFYLDCKIQHLLVDEYQDTSYKQEELLHKLTSEWSQSDGRSLFIVGDPKQSIYRFRDAEVGLFLKTQKRGLGNLKLETLSLKSNFRSQKNLVNWVNACFQKIFPVHEDSNLGAITYAKSSAVVAESMYPGVVYHPVPHNANSQNITEDEARKITNLVKDLQSQHSGKSIAILVRGRSHLNSIVKFFKESSIPFKAEDIDSLTDRSAILDLLSLMKALRYPENRTAWLSILRAPFCGLSLKDIHTLVELDTTTYVWTLLNDSSRMALLSESGKQRVLILTSHIHPFLKDFKDHNFRNVLEACWIKLGGPACLQGTSPDDIEVFFNKVEELMESGQEDHLESFDQILKDLYASPLATTTNAVQIMTMHKAKGLEFDFVLLPGLGKRIKTDEKRLVYWMPHGDDLLIAPIEEKGGEISPLYEFLSDINKEKEQYETLRLLYVASTRAKTQLHLFGHLNRSKDEEWKPHSQSLLHKLWPHVQEEWLQKLNDLSESSSAETDSTNTDSPSHRIHRVPLDFSIPVVSDSIIEGPLVEIEDEKNVEPDYFWAGNTARCLGNVVHRFLQKLSEEDLSGQPQDIAEKFKSRIRPALLAEGLPINQAEQATQACLQAITNILDDKRGLWILLPHEDAHSEYPLTFHQNNRYVRSIIDRTFVDNGVRWIIDYKTGSHKGGGKNLEIFLDHEVERYRHQLNRYESVLKKYGEKRPIKKALYFPLLKAWREVL